MEPRTCPGLIYSPVSANLFKTKPLKSDKIVVFSRARSAY
jgi:hypothetical protein